MLKILPLASHFTKGGRGAPVRKYPLLASAATSENQFTNVSLVQVMLKVNLPTRLRRKSVAAKDPLTAAARAATADLDNEDLPDDSIIKIKHSDPKINTAAACT